MRCYLSFHAMPDRRNGVTNSESLRYEGISLTGKEEEFLTGQGLVTVQMDGKTLRQMIAEGFRVNQDWYHYPDIVDVPSTVARVAYNPRNFYLSEEGGLSSELQKKKVDELTKVAKLGLPSLKATVLSVVEYAQIGRDHFEKTGQNLFRKGDLEFAATTTRTGSFAINVGMLPDGTLHLYQWLQNPSNSRIGVAPVIVHDPAALVQG